jgi:hypothetical protein
MENEYERDCGLALLETAGRALGMAKLMGLKFLWSIVSFGYGVLFAAVLVLFPASYLKAAQELIPGMPGRKIEDWSALVVLAAWLGWALRRLERKENLLDIVIRQMSDNTAIIKSVPEALKEHRNDVNRALEKCQRRG